MGEYVAAVEQLTDKGNIITVLLFLIAALVMLILAAKGVEAWRTLFGKPKPEKPHDKSETALDAHCRASEERFRDGERHIKENHKDIMDLKEGQRVLCNGMYEVLGHLLHNGNKDAMEKASSELFKYLNS